MPELIQKLEVPKYIIKIKTSESRNRKYYRKRKSKNKDEMIWKPRPLPKTKRENLEEGDWSMDSNNYLRDENGDKVVANPRAAGTPNYEPLSGNRFFSGYGSHHVRRTLTAGLKDFYRPYVNKMDKITKFPIRIDWDFHTTLNSADWDMDNMHFYWKYLQDTLVEEDIIPEDNIKYITFPPAGRFIPVKEWIDRKFVFRFYKDTRTEIQELWNERNFKL